MIILAYWFRTSNRNVGCVARECIFEGMFSGEILSPSCEELKTQVSTTTVGWLTRARDLLTTDGLRLFCVEGFAVEYKITSQI